MLDTSDTAAAERIALSRVHAAMSETPAALIAALATLAAVDQTGMNDAQWALESLQSLGIVTEADMAAGEAAAAKLIRSTDDEPWTRRDTDALRPVVL